MWLLAFSKLMIQRSMQQERQSSGSGGGRGEPTIAAGDTEIDSHIVYVVTVCATSRGAAFLLQFHSRDLRSRRFPTCPRMKRLFLSAAFNVRPSRSKILFEPQRSFSVILAGARQHATHSAPLVKDAFTFLFGRGHILRYES